MGTRGPDKEFSPEVFLTAVDEYINDYDSKIQSYFAKDEPSRVFDPFAIPSIHGFCQEKLGKSYKSFLYKYEKEPLYEEAVNKLQGWIINKLHILASVGILKSTWLNFYMKNMHDWRDKVDTQVSGKLNIMKITAEDEAL